LWYLADAMIDADNVDLDQRKKRQAEETAQDPAAEAKAEVIAEENARVGAAWAALPDEKRKAIITDHRRRFTVANESTARAEWWRREGKAQATDQPTRTEAPQ